MTYPFQTKKRERRKESGQGEEQKERLIHSFDLVDKKLFLFPERRNCRGELIWHSELFAMHISEGPAPYTFSCWGNLSPQCLLNHLVLLYSHTSKPAEANYI